MVAQTASKYILIGLVILGLSLAPSAAQAGSWLIDANAGVGVPSGTLGDDWSTGFLAGGKIGYLFAPLEIGVDGSWVQNTPSDDVEAILPSGSEAEFQFVQYGAHARWMAMTDQKASPYLGVGLGVYRVKGDYDDPDPAFSLEETQSAFGINGMAGLNYWLGRTWGLGFEVSYHSAMTDEEEVGYDPANFFAFTGGLRWNLGASR